MHVTRSAILCNTLRLLALLAMKDAPAADASAKGYLVYAAHISFPGIGHVAAGGSAYVCCRELRRSGTAPPR